MRTCDIVTCALVLVSLGQCGRAESSAPGDAEPSATPQASLDLVRGVVSYRPYAGFVKGPVAVLTDRTANAPDAAELLLFVLAQRGIPGRLAWGTLPEEQVTALLSSAFAGRVAPQQVQKALPGQKLADPVHDPALRKIASQHVWVQARWKEAWIDLDPVLPGAKAGQAPARVLRTGLPPQAQQRRQFCIDIYARNKGEAQPRRILQFQQPAPGLVGQRVLFFSQGPDDTADKVTREQLRPVLICGCLSPKSQPYGGAPRGGPAERIKNPFGSIDDDGAPPAPNGPALEEAWLDIRLTGGGRPDRSQRRYLYWPGEGGIDRMTDLTAFCITFGSPAPRDVRSYAEFSAELTGKTRGLKVPLTGKLNASQELKVRQGFCQAAEMTSALAQWLGVCSHAMRMRTDGAFGTVSDYDDARVLAVSMDGSGKALSTDLIFDTARTWPAPGTKLAGEALAPLTCGLIESDMEAGVLAALGAKAGQSTDKMLTARSVFEAAANAGIKPVLVWPREKGAVDKLALPAVTRRLVAQRLQEGCWVLIPPKPVVLAGRSVCAWYEMEPRTGHWAGVWQDGRHQAMTEYFENTSTMAVVTIDTITRGISSSATMYTYAGAVLEVVSDDADQTWAQIHYYAMKRASEPRHWEPLMLAYKELMSVFGKKNFDVWVAVDILNDFAEKKVPADAAKAILDGQVAALAFLDSGNPGALVPAWLPKDPRGDMVKKLIEGLKKGVISELKAEFIPEDIREMQKWYDRLQKVEKLADNIAKANAAAP